MWCGGRIDDRHIVTKHVARSFHGYTEVPHSKAQINNLFHTSAGSNILRSESGSLNSRLQLGEPINGCLVEEMQDTSDRLTTNQIVVEVGIGKGMGDNALASGAGALTGISSLVPLQQVYFQLHSVCSRQL